jgi:hypothetical protein
MRDLMVQFWFGWERRFSVLQSVAKNNKVSIGRAVFSRILRNKHQPHHILHSFLSFNDRVISSRHGERHDGSHSPSELRNHTKLSYNNDQTKIEDRILVTRRKILMKNMGELCTLASVEMLNDDLRHK